MSHEKAHSILIVEDERIVAKDLQQTLSGMGYDAFAIASSAEEAMARASEKCPDVVLMDIRIKGDRDGIQTAAILRSRFNIPVVYLTAHADEATIERAKKTEPYGYLLKPIKSAELRSAIEVSLYRHEMEKRLRERERWFSTTLHSIADAVVTVNLAGKVTYLNPAAEILIGSKAEEVIGQSAADVLRLVDQRPPVIDATPLATALRTNQPVELEEASLLNLSTGARHLINDSTAPVVDEGQTLGAVMVFRDVTEKKKLQKQLELADRLTSLGTMAAGAAHELNNPLAIVVTNASFVAEELQQHRSDLEAKASIETAQLRLDKMSEALRDLQSAASRMGRIVSDLRTFSRPAEESPEVIDLAHCIEWAIRATSHEFHHRAQLRTEFGETPPVIADETRLEQVLVNLLVNAAHAIPPGSADRNEVCIATRTDERGRVVIEIRDTGEGIARDVLKRIFDPFFTTKTIGVGTGLGLSICHGIVNSLGGEIQVESELGKGTTFRVLLPPAAPVEKSGAATAPGVPETAKPLVGRILVIDDEDMLLRSIKWILEDENHDVICTESAREALTLIESGQRFDVILSDLMMPTMTGMEFYEILLTQSPDVARRVVFISGGAITAKVDAFLRSVPNLTIEKPFKIATLRDTVQQLLAEQTTQRTPVTRRLIVVPHQA
jgi:two-component system, cell cycle sensor histidine kinase and response regulator CckA